MLRERLWSERCQGRRQPELPPRERVRRACLRQHDHGNEQKDNKKDWTRKNRDAVGLKNLTFNLFRYLQRSSILATTA